MTDTRIQLRHATDIDDVWNSLIDIYAEIRADLLHQPHYSVERYGERLARHAQEAGWETVIGYDGNEPVGYAYVNTLQLNDRWWQRMTTPLPGGCTDIPRVALKEIMLRGTGTARRIHDELLATRPEQQVSLLVNPQAGGGKVQTLYEGWGYEVISAQQPSADGPVLTAMLRTIREGPPPVGDASAPSTR